MFFRFCVQYIYFYILVCFGRVLRTPVFLGLLTRKIGRCALPPPITVSSLLDILFIDAQYRENPRKIPVGEKMPEPIKQYSSRAESNYWIVFLSKTESKRSRLSTSHIHRKGGWFMETYPVNSCAQRKLIPYLHIQGADDKLGQTL